jgi:hypothetical protein
VTVEDPDVLLQPWRQTPMLRTLAGAGGGAAGGFGRPGLVGAERGNCEVYEEGRISSQIRH